MTFQELLQLAIVHEAEAWFPGCEADAADMFVSYLADLQRFDRRTFDRAIHDIVHEIHLHEGEAQAA